MEFEGNSRPFETLLIISFILCHDSVLDICDACRYSKTRVFDTIISQGLEALAMSMTRLNHRLRPLMHLHEAGKRLERNG